MSWADVDAFLARIKRIQPSNAAGLLAMLETFVAANEDPGRSPNFRDQVGEPKRFYEKCRPELEKTQSLVLGKSNQGRHLQIASRSFFQLAAFSGSRHLLPALHERQSTVRVKQSNSQTVKQSNSQTVKQSNSQTVKQSTINSQQLIVRIEIEQSLIPPEAQKRQQDPASLQPLFPHSQTF